MKRVFSIFLTAIMMMSIMAVPAFADDADEWLTSKDKWGHTIYVRGNGDVNNDVAPLSECPTMDYVKTIDGVTFSNYIRHTTAKTKDEAGNIISIYKVYIGLNGAMRSDKDTVEFMTAPSQPYNTLNGYIKSRNGYYVNVCSDLNMFKTNTPMLMGSADFDLDYLTDIGITPYADGGSDGRAMDGTWKKGLTWVFDRYENGEKSNGTYTAVYPIRVNQGETVTYYQVAVTDATNYSGQRVDTSKPTTPPVSDSETVALKSFSDVPETHWAHSYVMLCVQHGAIAGTRSPDANGIGSFSPNTNVTLGQFLTVLTRLLAEDQINSEAYPQSQGYHWAYANFVAAVESGIIEGDDFKSDHNGLNQALNREDMAYILSRAAEVNGENLEILPRVETMMKDYNTISADRKEAVKQAYSNGLLAGYGDGSFGPKDTMTRAQMATVVCRLMEYAPRGTVQVPDDSKPEVIVSQNKADYVNVDGTFKGYLKPAFSREKELEALKQIKLGEDSKGVYMTVTAPSLPDVIKNEFTYTFVCTVYNSKGDYFADQARVEGLKAGETKTAYLVSFQDTGVKSSEISEIRLSVMINNATGYEHMFTRSISNTDKSTAYAKYDDGYSDNVKFDSTSIWKGIGK